MDPGFRSVAFRRSYSEALVLVLVYAVGKKNPCSPSECK